MELRHIRYFLAVAEENNFTRAAAKIGIGQPPLSQQIKDLEHEVGTQLFRRVPHGAELTEAGLAFLHSIQDVPDRVKKAKRAAQRAARGETGSLQVGFTGSTAFHPAVAATIRTFRRRYPDVDLALVEVNTAGLSKKLRNGDIQAAFLRPGITGFEDFQLRPYPDEPMLAVLPANHPAAQQEALELTELSSDPFLFTPRESGQNIVENTIDACRACGFDPILGQPAPQIGSVVNLVATELGVALVPDSMKAVQVPGVVYRPIKGHSPTINMSLATTRGNTSQTLRNFLQCAHHTARDLGFPFG
jgi:DNA-binding transcriptional LysR family regulator